jgi:hypothetical protein
MTRGLMPTRSMPNNNNGRLRLQPSSITAGRSLLCAQHRFAAQHLIDFERPGRLVGVVIGGEILRCATSRRSYFSQVSDTKVAALREGWLCVLCWSRSSSPYRA